VKRSKNSTLVIGTFSLVSAAFLYGTFGILSRIVGYDLPLFYQSWVRVLVAAAILSVTFRSWHTISWSHWLWIGIRAAAGLAAFLLFFIAINALPVNMTYFVFYGGSTLGGFLYGAFLFRERTTPLRIASLLLAGIGLFMVYGFSTAQTNPMYAIFAFASGICTATWNILAKKIKGYPPSQMAFLDNALSFPIHLALSLVFSEAWPILEPSAAQTANISLGVLFAVTGLLMVYGFRKLDAQIGSLIMLSEILFAITLGFFVYQETLTFGAFIGGALIITAMILPELNWKYMYTTLFYAHRRKKIS